MGKDKLTNQDKKFVKVVVETGNQTMAAKKAYGIKDDGYARLKGHRMITKDNVKKSIATIADSIPDNLLIDTHLGLLNATGLDHMVFPLGCEFNRDKEKYILLKKEDAKKKKIEYVETDILSDEDIIELLAGVNCTVRKVVHGDTARHVYFWASDNKARQAGLDMAYKIKGTYANVKVEFEFSPKKDLKEYD